MRVFLGLLLLTLVFSSCATRPEAPATKLEKANVLPLALNTHFQIRKIIRYYYDASLKKTCR